MAVKNCEQNHATIIHHSDRGIQYCCPDLDAGNIVFQEVFDFIVLQMPNKMIGMRNIFQCFVFFFDDGILTKEEYEGRRKSFLINR